jgi:hypothetical protein
MWMESMFSMSNQMISAQIGNLSKRGTHHRRAVGSLSNFRKANISTKCFSELEVGWIRL